MGQQPSGLKRRHVKLVTVIVSSIRVVEARRALTETWAAKNYHPVDWINGSARRLPRSLSTWWRTDWPKRCDNNKAKNNSPNVSNVNNYNSFRNTKNVQSLMCRSHYRHQHRLTFGLVYRPIYAPPCEIVSYKSFKNIFSDCRWLNCSYRFRSNREMRVGRNSLGRNIKPTKERMNSKESGAS